MYARSRSVETLLDSLATSPLIWASVDEHERTHLRLTRLRSGVAALSTSTANIKKISKGGAQESQVEQHRVSRYSNCRDIGHTREAHNVPGCSEVLQAAISETVLVTLYSSDVCVSDADLKSRRRGCLDVTDEFGVPSTSFRVAATCDSASVFASALATIDFASQAPYSGSGSVYDEVRREETPRMPGLTIALGSKDAEYRLCRVSLVCGVRKRRSSEAKENELG